MNKGILKVFEIVEGNLLMIIMNFIIIEYFDKQMKVNGYSDVGYWICLYFIKVGINEVIKNGLF